MTTPTNSKFDASMRWIGDLDHEFYDDERQRFVWYEAQAIGYQLMVLVTLLSAGVSMIVLGRSSGPTVFFVLAPMVISSVALFGWTTRHSAEYLPKRSDLTRPRGLLVGALAGVYAIGIVRSTVDGTDTSASEIAGLVVGIVTGGLVVGLVIVVINKMVKSNSRNEDDDEF